MVRLGDVCEILDNMRIPIKACDRKAGPYPYYGANGLQDYIDNYIFDDELVLLAEDGGNFGSKDKPIAYRVSGKCWVNNHAHVLKPKQNLDVDYLCYSLMYYDVSGLVNGATRQKLTQADMKKIEISLPKFEEQKKIVKILDKLNEIINKRQQQLKKLDEIVKSRFIEMFGDPVTNSKMWEIDCLGNITTKIGSGMTPRGGKESYLATGVALIRSMNVHDGKFEYKDLAYISAKQASEMKNVELIENDVLFNITGASVTRTCVVPNTILPARVNQHVAIIRCINESLNPIFLNNLFLQDGFKYKLLNLARAGGATREAITKQQLEDLNVILPPIEIQNQFADFVEQTDKSKLEIQKSLDKLEILKKSLMQQYFG